MVPNFLGKIIPRPVTGPRTRGGRAPVPPG